MVMCQTLPTGIGLEFVKQLLPRGCAVTATHRDQADGAAPPRETGRLTRLQTPTACQVCCIGFPPEHGVKCLVSVGGAGRHRPAGEAAAPGTLTALAAGGKLQTVLLDVADEASIFKAAAALQAKGVTFTHVVHNAGVYGDLEEFDGEQRVPPPGLFIDYVECPANAGGWICWSMKMVTAGNKPRHPGAKLNLFEVQSSGLSKQASKPSTHMPQKPLKQSKLQPGTERHMPCVLQTLKACTMADRCTASLQTLPQRPLTGSSPPPPRRLFQESRSRR